MNEILHYHIRRMTPEDIPAVVGIENVCFSEPWSEAAYHATLLLPYARYYVAELWGRSTWPEMNRMTCGPADKTVSTDAGADRHESCGTKIAGMIGLELIAGDGEISNVAVLPQYRRQGIAHALMEQVLSEGQQEGCTAFTLEVRAGNTAAIALYESFGFRTEGVRKGYYEKPAEDALILWRRE